MAAAGVMFEIGAILLAAAQNYVMLIIGRCFLGVAVRGAVLRGCRAFHNAPSMGQHVKGWLHVPCRSRLPASQSQCTTGEATAFQLCTV